ncbi:MAG: hypothetical protein SGJ09_04610 [Phycisphaerae bacterium]|nr:hypothetical protein [Phycisphaerae bacterium]
MHTIVLAAILASLSAVPGTTSADPPAPVDGTRAVPGVTPEPKRRPPLLRESSFMVRAGGEMRGDEKRNEWLFLPNTRDASGLQREIVLLPNDTLAEAIRTQRLAPTPIRFEATGEVFIYHSRNYVLLSMMTPVVAVETPAPTPTPTVKPDGKPVPKPASPATPTTPVDEEAIAADLERRLAARIGSLPKVVTAAPAIPRAQSGAVAVPTAVPSSDSRVMSRRGHLLRDASTGGWRFVFDGQLAEGGDPSMPVLPCLALERVEQLVRETESQAPLLVSGSTTSFEGRTFLLPTSFRIARGGKGVNP